MKPQDYTDFHEIKREKIFSLIKSCGVKSPATKWRGEADKAFIIDIHQNPHKIMGS
ncbi:MAG: hypothetical protein ABIK81_02350 [candidate division WOR-3 bacterium]